MSNHDNKRRGEKKRTEHGPRWENQNPGKGSNSTHVAKSRKKWKRVKARSERRTGKTSPKVYTQQAVDHRDTLREIMNIAETGPVHPEDHEPSAFEDAEALDQIAEIARKALKE